MLKKAEALVKAGDLIAILDYGAELSDEIKAASVELEKLKTFVRQEAIKRAAAGEDPPIKIAHTHGQTSISIPEKQWKPKRGKDPMKLEDELPEAIFDVLFTTPRSIELKDKFETELKKLEQSQRDTVRCFFEYVAAAPKISFPAMPAKQVVIATASVSTPTADDDSRDT